MQWVARFRWLVLATVVVLVLLLMPGSDVPTVVSFPHIDLVVHVAIFFGWSLALVHDVSAVQRTPWLVVPAVLVFGLLSETLQLFASGRSFDLRDVAADLVGATLAVLAVGIRKRVVRART
ncbi:MAG: VanZ family protein [Actinomycetes bacterium]